MGVRQLWPLLSQCGGAPERVLRLIVQGVRRLRCASHARPITAAPAESGSFFEARWFVSIVELSSIERYGRKIMSNASLNNDWR
jgi:hypothetical protein